MNIYTGEITQETHNVSMLMNIDEIIKGLAHLHSCFQSAAD